MAKTDGFVPSKAPDQTDPNLSALSLWIEHEFGRVAAVLQDTALLKISPLYVEPAKPRDGMLVYADGTHWNPGSGAGPYARIAGVWTKLFP